MNFKNVVTGIALAVVAGLLNTSCTPEFDPTYLEQQIKDLDNRLTQLETAVKGMNSQIADLQTIVRSLESNAHISSIDQKSDETVLTFSNGKTVVIRTSGAPQAPVIGVKAVDGVYYWTLDGEFLTDAAGNRLPVSGTDGKDGADGTDGADGHTPVIGVMQSGDDLYWTVDGKFLLDASGNKVIASYRNSGNGSGDSIFKSVKVENGVVTITLNDGNSFVIPMKAAASLRIEATKLHFTAGETKEVHLDLTNTTGVTVTDKPDGWRTSINGNTLKVQAPTAETAEEEGFVTLLATSGDQTFIGKVKLTMEAPLFTMKVNPDGTMILTELDTDFNAPGFWAGFVKADEFDPAAIAAPAKDYTPSKEDFYTSWSSALTGKNSYEVKISESITAPKAGERYAAYCFPGAYSKWIGVEPDPYDVEVVYFTYVDGSFSDGTLAADLDEILASCEEVEIALTQFLNRYNDGLKNAQAFEEFNAKYEDLQKSWTMVYNLTFGNKENAAYNAKVEEELLPVLSGINQMIDEKMTWATESFENGTLAAELDEILASCEEVEIALTQFLNRYNDGLAE